MVPQITRDNFSRVRGKSADKVTIVKRNGIGKWSKNHVFSKCSKCGGMAFYRICQYCDNIDLTLDTKKKELIRTAVDKYRIIFPCVNKVKKKELLTDFHKCFTSQQDKLLFWFNDQTHSSRVVLK